MRWTNGLTPPTPGRGPPGRCSWPSYWPGELPIPNSQRPIFQLSKLKSACAVWALEVGSWELTRTDYSRLAVEPTSVPEGDFLLRMARREPTRGPPACGAPLSCKDMAVVPVLNGYPAARAVSLPGCANAAKSRRQSYICGCGASWSLLHWEVSTLKRLPPA